ncbi:MAG: helix-turn-helix transcriptional regulator [Acidobacteriaceae bacterium]
MRRADRLFQIVQYLRGRRLTTAAQLSAWLHVSERTIYRDIRDLSLSGVPVLSEAGVGYRLSSHFDLPPIMFTFDEVEALVAGARAIEAWGGVALADSARSAISKIIQVLPPSRRNDVERTHLYAPGFHVRSEVYAFIDPIRLAIQHRSKLKIAYRDGKNNASTRVIRPLGLYFWGDKWTLAAYCESRMDFRSFRLDRIGALEDVKQRFEEEKGRTLEDFLRKVSTLPIS